MKSDLDRFEKNNKEIKSVHKKVRCIFDISEKLLIIFVLC